MKARIRRNITSVKMAYRLRGQLLQIAREDQRDLSYVIRKACEDYVQRRLNGNSDPTPTRV